MGALLGVTRVDFAVFWVCAVIVVAGGVGVVLSRQPVYAALSLVLTMFGIAVLFVAQDANFLAAVQVIVYAGAIVVLFLFVIMFLGVDRREDLRAEPLRSQRVLAPVLVAMALAVVLLLGATAHWAVGAPEVVGPARGQPGGDVAALGRAVFTDYLWPFEITAGLLIIAVVGAVVLARRPPGPQAEGDPEEPDELTEPAGGLPPSGDRQEPVTPDAGGQRFSGDVPNPAPREEPEPSEEEVLS